MNAYRYAGAIVKRLKQHLMGKRTIIFIVILVLAAAGALVYIRNPWPFDVAWAKAADAVRGDIGHNLSCYDLPFYPQVEKAMQGHQDIVDKLKAIAGVTSVEPQLVKCYTFDGSNYFVKGDILINYTDRGATKAIRQTIGDNFFGIPYRGHKQ